MDPAPADDEGRQIHDLGGSTPMVREQRWGRVKRRPVTMRKRAFLLVLLLTTLPDLGGLLLRS